jgi:hypothetical protein
MSFRRLFLIMCVVGLAALPDLRAQEPWSAFQLDGSLRAVYEVWTVGISHMLPVTIQAGRLT